MYYDFQFSATEEEQQHIIESTLVKDWLSTMDPEMHIRGLKFQSADFIQKKGKKHLLFLKVHCDVVDEQGRKVNGIVLLRGGAVACLVVLICEGIRYILFVEQARIGIGSRNCAEIPAGMLDHSNDFEGVMITELEEEAHLTVQPGEMIDLTHEILGMEQTGIYTSVGGMDEFLRLFVLEREVDRDFIEEHHTMQRIHESEDEVIEIKVLPYAEAAQALSRDLKNVCALYLYEQWKEKNG